MVPNLNPKHEAIFGKCRDTIGIGVSCIQVGGRGGDDDFIESVDKFVIKSDDERDDDEEGKDATEKCAVLGLSFVSKEFSRVEKVKFVK